jgi:hypothetical protein
MFPGYLNLSESSIAGFLAVLCIVFANTEFATFLNSRWRASLPLKFQQPLSSDGGFLGFNIMDRKSSAQLVRTYKLQDYQIAKPFLNISSRISMPSRPIVPSKMRPSIIFNRCRSTLVFSIRCLASSERSPVKIVDKMSQSTHRIS